MRHELCSGAPSFTVTLRVLARLTAACYDGLLLRLHRDLSKGSPHMMI
jgi:hypothetical protein